MAAFAAAASVKRRVWNSLVYRGILLDQEILNILECIYREMGSFIDLLERMDSRGRKRMRASLHRSVEVMSKFDEDPGSNYECLMETVKKVREEYYEYSSLHEDHDQEAVPSSSSSSSTFKSKRVGLSDVWNPLKEELVVPWIREGIGLGLLLSLFGMAGIGKTTLAREIFEDLDIVEWFDCRAWVTVSGGWTPRDIALAILAQVEPAEMVKGGDDQEIVERLKESLKDKRFLVVLDDVWDEADFQDFLKSSFPDGKDGSQVLLTSRETLEGIPYVEMRLLNEEESWQLLCQKVFNGGLCPPKLEDAGKKIASTCDGLPLTILTVAELLAKAVEETTPELLWNEVATNKKHRLFIEAYDEISQVLHPSYENLVDVCKPCFLYMGVFPLKYVIPASKLINLWVAEDFISLDLKQELAAVIYLGIFQFKSFVMVSERSTNLVPTTLKTRGVKACRLHSSWWQFCQRESRKKNFFYVLDCYDDGLKEGLRGQKRLSVHNNVLFGLKDVYNSIEENCASTVESLLCFGPYNQYMVPVCFGLSLLERLDALNIRFYEFPLEVLKLIKLRYLALTCNGKLPPSISKLEKLQYLIVFRHSRIKSCGAQSYLPEEIWDMKNLKHLRIVGCDLPDLGDDSLPKLATLSDVSTDSCKALKRVPNLKKLGIRIELTPNASEPLYCFDRISYATKLESLKCVIVNPGSKFRVASFPSLQTSLKKLSLSGLGYQWEEMSKIALLPNLEVLKLKYNAFQGPKWEVEENGFKKLYHLQLEDIDLVQLKCASGSFKCLVVVRIKHCYKLKELNLDNNCEGDRVVEIVDCNPLMERNIKDNIWVNNEELIAPKLEIHYSWKS